MVQEICCLNLSFQYSINLYFALLFHYEIYHYHLNFLITYSFHLINFYQCFHLILIKLWLEILDLLISFSLQFNLQHLYSLTFYQDQNSFFLLVFFMDFPQCNLRKQNSNILDENMIQFSLQIFLQSIHLIYSIFIQE